MRGWHDGNRFDRRALESARRDLLDEIRLLDELDMGSGERRRFFFRDPREREYDNYLRSRSRGRRELLKELQAIGAVESRIGRTKDPYIRELAREIVRETERHGLTLSDLTGRRDSRGILSGNGLYLALAGLLGLLLVPSAGQKLKDLLSRAAGEITDLTDKAQTMVERTKEELEDIVAEAQFNRFKEALDPGTE